MEASAVMPMSTSSCSSGSLALYSSVSRGPNGGGDAISVRPGAAGSVAGRQIARGNVRCLSVLRGRDGTSLPEGELAYY